MQADLEGRACGAVAVSGFGMVSAAGAGAAALQQALLLGETRIGALTDDVGAALPVRVGGVFPSNIVPLDQTSSRAFIACDLALGEALHMAGLTADVLPGGGRLCGLSLGTALGEIGSVDGLLRGDRVKNAKPREMLVHDLSNKLAHRHSIGGPVSTFSATCLSSVYAMEQALLDLQTSRADVVVCGGVDTLSRFMQSGFCSLGALGGTLGEISAHPGLILGEAACFLVLEPLARVTERGGDALAVIAGRATCTDGIHITSPDAEGSGMIRAIRSCLESSGRQPHDVSSISVTASASPVYARMYDKVMSEVFPVAKFELTSWEECIGHVLAASGVFGMAHATMQLQRRGLAEPGSQGDGDVLALTVGFGGQNGATLLATPARTGLFTARGC